MGNEKRVIKMAIGVEHMAYNEKLRQLGLFS